MVNDWVYMAVFALGLFQVVVSGALVYTHFMSEGILRVQLRVQGKYVFQRKYVQLSDFKSFMLALLLVWADPLFIYFVASFSSA